MFYDGHRFVHTADEGFDQCLICGGTWSAGAVGRWAASDGDWPTSCPGRTDVVYGYPGERVCEAANGRPCEAAQERGTCEHTDHQCNCVYCQ